MGKERGGGKPWDVTETLKELVKDTEHQKHVVCKMLAHVVCKMLARDRRNNRDRWSTTAPVNHIMAAFAITVAIRAELETICSVCKARSLSSNESKPLWQCSASCCLKSYIVNMERQRSAESPNAPKHGYMNTTNYIPCWHKQFHISYTLFVLPSTVQDYHVDWRLYFSGPPMDHCSQPKPQPSHQSQIAF